MSKRKVGDIEVKIDAGDFYRSFKPSFHIADDAKETYKYWGIDGFSKEYFTKKDKSEMKVIGTYINNKIVLDTPVEYTGVFNPPKALTSMRNGNRYEFEVKTMGSAKPEIISANKIENKRDTRWQIVLDGSAVVTCPNSTSRAEPIVVKMIAEHILKETLESDWFKTAREEYLEKAKETGQITVYTGNDVFEKLLVMNSEEYALFSVVTDDNAPVQKQHNQTDENGLFVENFYLQSDIVPLLAPFESAIKLGQRFSLMLTGEAGYGKTTAFKAIAQNLNIPYLYVDCSVMLNTTDWFGTMQAKDGDTFFEPTEFTRMLEAGNCVIILDEFNRLSIEVANSLLPILDDRAEIRVKGRHIKVGDGILFGITLNNGIEYTGIGGMLDKAIKSRIFGQVEVKPLPYSIELEVLTRNYDLPPEVAEKIVNTMTILRDVCRRQREDMNFITADVSTRTSKMIAWWVEKGLDINLALEYALYNFIGRDERVLFVDALGNSKR